MSRISKLSPDQWDPELREMFAADSATQLELGTMRMFAHRPGIAKGIHSGARTEEAPRW